MSKWEVFKDNLYPRQWCALNPGNYQETERFMRHAEALAYADERARTVEVVLPRVHAVPTVRHMVQKNGLVIEYVRSKSHPQLQPSYVVVEPWERRPLALALLALAEQEADQ